MAVRRKNKYRYVMRRVFAPILLGNVFNTMMKDEELPLADVFEIRRKDDVHTFRFIRRNRLPPTPSSVSRDSTPEPVEESLRPSVNLASVAQSRQTLKSLEVPRSSILRISAQARSRMSMSHETEAAKEETELEGASPPKSGTIEEIPEEEGKPAPEKEYSNEVWESWYPVVSPLQAGLGQLISEILKTSLEEAGSAEQAAEFFSEHNMRYFTALYSVIIRDLSAKSEDVEYLRQAFASTIDPSEKEQN